VSYENRIEELQRELRLLGEEKEKVIIIFTLPFIGVVFNASLICSCVF
jgi:hypothetical protein